MGVKTSTLSADGKKRQKDTELLIKKLNSMAVTVIGSSSV
jgi:hypothetical protein